MQPFYSHILQSRTLNKVQYCANEDGTKVTRLPVAVIIISTAMQPAIIWQVKENKIPGRSIHLMDSSVVDVKCHFPPRLLLERPFVTTYTWRVTFEMRAEPLVVFMYCSQSRKLPCQKYIPIDDLSWNLSKYKISRIIRLSVFHCKRTQKGRRIQRL